MENASDALIIAGSILLFMIALSVSILSLSNIRTQAQEFFSQNEQVELAVKDDDYINYIQSDENEIRDVGAETIISAINRISKENYDIYIEFNNVFSTTNSDITNMLRKDKRVLFLTIREGKNKNISKDAIRIIYDKIKDYKFQEFLGIYKEKAGEGTLEAERTTYRVINFKQKK